MIFNLLASHDAMDHVLPHRFGKPLMHWNIDFQAPFNLFHITPHDTYFTNQMLMTIVAAVILLALFPIMGRRYAAALAMGPERSVPRGFTNLIESMMQFVREGVARPVLHEKTDRFMPFLWTVFFYILVCNLLGMIPFDSIVYLLSGQKLQHIGGTATGNIMITAGLATCAFLAIHLSGIFHVYHDLVSGVHGHHHHGDQGHGDADLPAVDDHPHHETHAVHHQHHAPRPVAAPIAAVIAPLLYLWNFAPHVFRPEETKGPLDLVMWVFDIVMWAGLLTLEFIGALIKPFALAIRLFANMVAGHVVLASILALIFAFKGSVSLNYGMGVVASLGAAALSCLELFVCFLQAYVFTFLTTLFIGASVSPEH